MFACESAPDGVLEARGKQNTGLLQESPNSRLDFLVLWFFIGGRVLPPLRLSWFLVCSQWTLTRNMLRMTTSMLIGNFYFAD